MSSNKFEALGSDDSEVEESMNNQLEVSYDDKDHAELLMIHL